jgi:hypothetical protein
MAKSNRYLILFVLLFLWVPVGHAQTNGPGLERVVEVEFTVFARDRHAGIYFRPSAGKPLEELEFFRSSRSPVYRYKGPAELVFYDSPIGETEVARLTVAPELTRLLLLFIPVREPQPGGRRFNVFGVNDSTSALPPGKAMVLNASGLEYAAMIGSEQLMLPKGLSTAVPASGKVTFQLAWSDGEGWFNAGYHEFSTSPGARTCLVLFPPRSATGIGPLIRTLVDEPPEASN